MSHQEKSVVHQTEQFVRHLFSTRIDPAFSFHTLSHTESVVAAAMQMADHYLLLPEERLPLLLAAWFHDTGYSQGKADAHEQESVQVAMSFLKKFELSETTLEKIKNCIMATRMPQRPANLIEKIICDADLHHLGTERFEEENKLLRQELNKTQGKDISKAEWRKVNIQFLEAHRFYTDYARQHLEEGKQVNIQKLKAKEEARRQKEAMAASGHDKNGADPVVAATPPTDQAPPVIPIKKEKEKAKDGQTERGVATMFRIMSENHVNLSQMADSKANIMISVNTIMLSIMVSVLFSKLQYYPQFIIPTILLCGVSLSAIIFAILATRPNVNKGTFTKEDIAAKKINLLFFGNFFRMDLAEYDWAMREMMNDKEYLYGSMIKDIYFLGKVLAKKYRFLRMSYNIFMVGLVVAILAFGIAFAISDN